MTEEQRRSQSRGRPMVSVSISTCYPPILKAGSFTSTALYRTRRRRQHPARQLLSRTRQRQCHSRNPAQRQRTSHDPRRTRRRRKRRESEERGRTHAGSSRGRTESSSHRASDFFSFFLLVSTKQTRSLYLTCSLRAEAAQETSSRPNVHSLAMVPDLSRALETAVKRIRGR